MQIYSINNSYIDRVSFSGLTKKMKKRMYIDGKKDILEIIEERQPNQSTYVGQLPPGILYNLPKDKALRTVAIKEIMASFGVATTEIRNFIPGYSCTSEERRNRRPQVAVDAIGEVLSKYNLLEPGQDFNLIYLGSGDYGHAYKLDGIKDNTTNDEYVLKVFRVANRDANDWHRYKSHGNYAELNTAAYWTETFGKDTQRGKFYFGDMASGYLVENYIDDSVPQPKRVVNEYDRGIKLTDEELSRNGHNRINNYSIDWGGVRVVNRVKNNNKIARYVLNNIKKTPVEQREAKWWEIYDDKTLDEVSRKAGLALAIKHMHRPETFISTCLAEDIPLVDQALAYALKYLPYRDAKTLFGTLMRRNNTTTQVILMNEIPLLARNPRNGDTYDDLDVPKEEIDAKKLEIYYKIADKYANNLSREHLASYVHLLPENQIMKEFNKLLALNDDRVYERLLHKMRIVKEEEFPSSLKLEMLSKLSKVVTTPYLKQRVADVRVFVIRSTLDDND